MTETKSVLPAGAGGTELTRFNALKITTPYNRTAGGHGQGQRCLYGSLKSCQRTGCSTGGKRGRSPDARPARQTGSYEQR